MKHLIKGPIARPVKWQWHAIIFVKCLPWVANPFPMATSLKPSICRATSFQLLKLMIKQTKALELVCLQSDPSTYAEAENIHENCTMGGTWWNNTMSSGVLWLCCCHIILCACRKISKDLLWFPILKLKNRTLAAAVTSQHAGLKAARLSIVRCNSWAEFFELLLTLLPRRDLEQVTFHSHNLWHATISSPPNSAYKYTCVIIMYIQKLNIVWNHCN